MGTPNSITIIIEAAPLTGGSGGGPNKNIWAHPEPQGIFGMNSNFVYGANVSVACPLNFQVAFGSNVQICINPFAFQTLCADSGFTTASAAYHKILGGGTGGNMQFTMGTSANFVMGQIYDINLGPRRITIDVHNKTLMQPVTKGLGIAFIIVVFAFILAYGLIPDDDARMILTMAFQLTSQIMLMVLMDVEGLYNQMDVNAKLLFNQAFSAHVDGPKPGDPPPPVVPQDDLSDFPAAMAAANAVAVTPEGKEALGNLTTNAILLCIVIPIVLEIVSEIKLDKPQAPTTVVDDSGHTIGTVDDSGPTGFGTF